MVIMMMVMMMMLMSFRMFDDKGEDDDGVRITLMVIPFVMGNIIELSPIEDGSRGC